MCIWDGVWGGCYSIEWNRLLVVFNIVNVLPWCEIRVCWLKNIIKNSVKVQSQREIFRSSTIGLSLIIISSKVTSLHHHDGIIAMVVLLVVTIIHTSKQI